MRALRSSKSHRNLLNSGSTGYIHPIFIEFIITTCMHCFCYVYGILPGIGVRYTASLCSVLRHAYLHEMTFPVNYMYFKN